MNILDFILKTMEENMNTHYEVSIQTKDLHTALRPFWQLSAEVSCLYGLGADTIEELKQKIVFMQIRGEEECSIRDKFPKMEVEKNNFFFQSVNGLYRLEATFTNQGVICDFIFEEEEKKAERILEILQRHHWNTGQEPYLMVDEKLWELPMKEAMYKK